MPMQIRRTATANNPPTALAEGQLAVEMANPLRLWCGVPTGIDASGRRLLIPSSVFSGATNPATPAAGDFFYNTATNTLLYYDGTAWQPVLFDAPADGTLYARADNAWEPVPIPIPPADVPAVPIGGKLRAIGSTPSNQVGYFPFNGGWMRIAGTDYPLPVAGVIATRTNTTIDGVPGQTLAANTLYYVYLFVDGGGNLQMEFSATGHQTSSTAGNVGMEIKQGDDSRSLVGIVQMAGDSMFYDSNSNRYVRSWYNRSAASLNAAGNLNSGTGGWSPVFGVNMVNWDGEAVAVTASGTLASASQPNVGIGFYVNATLIGGNTINMAVAGQTWSVSAVTAQTLNEGFNQIRVGVQLSSTSMTGAGAISGVLT